jgi:hypothetical protein
MSHTERETGTINILLERLNKERLPRLLEIKSHVDAGECLQDLDIEYLAHSLQDANDNRQHFAAFPEYADIASNIVRLYHEITERALENEKARANI